MPCLQAGARRGLLKSGMPSCSSSLQLHQSVFYFCCVLKDFIYLFLERGEGREKEMKRNIGKCCDWGPGPQPRRVP